MSFPQTHDKGTALKRSLVLASAFMCAVLSSTAGAQGTASTTSDKLTEFFGVLIDGGEWRTPNPNHEAGSSAPTEFILRYRWGPYEQHMVGELLGHFAHAGGSQERLFWTLYAIHNPVTDEVQVSQIGANGALAEGRIETSDDGKHIIEQTLYGPDGSTKELRHEETFAEDRKSYTSYVFERNENGEWVKVRDWIWTRSVSPLEE